MQMITIPITGFWVTCQEDSDLDREFSPSQFHEAMDYLDEQRRLWPRKEIEMIAEVEA